MQTIRIGKPITAVALAVSLAACATVARVTNLANATCNAKMRQSLSAILLEQGESAQASQSLAARTLESLSSSELGPRPFVISAPTGTDYGFFVQKKSDACLLRLYARQHGFVRYANNLTYIATRRLTGCACAE